MPFEKDNQPKFPEKLNKSGREIRKLLRTYQKPYWWKTNTELQTQSPLKCNECKGDLILMDDFATCTNCGLQNFRVYQTKIANQFTENYQQKKSRQERLHDKQIKVRPDLVNVKILRSINDKIKSHLRSINKPKYAWICEAILTKITEENA